MFDFLNNLLEQLSRLLAENIWISPIIALFAGFLTSLMPCCISTLPLVIGYVSTSEDNSKKRALKISLMFSLGMTITLTIIGILAAFAAIFLGRLAGNWWNIILAVIMVLMTLQIWEVINIIPSTNAVSKNKKRGYLGALIAGLLSGLFSSSCSTPVLVALFTIIASSESLILGIVLLLFYSAGNSILSIVAGVSTGALNNISQNPSYGKISIFIKVVLGLLMLIIALYLFYIAF